MSIVEELHRTLFVPDLLIDALNETPLNRAPQRQLTGPGTRAGLLSANREPGKTALRAAHANSN